MTRRLDLQEIDRQLRDLTGWAFLGDAVHATYEAPDFPAAVRLVSAVAEVAQEMDHHPDVDLRWRRVRFELSTHSESGVTQLDVELGHRIAAEAATVGAAAVSRPVGEPALRRLEIGLDCTDAAAVLPFWREGLGYDERRDDDGDIHLHDPLGRGPDLWFQGMDPARTERNRFHLDVSVDSPAAARGLLDRLQAVGGRLVSDQHAPSWWVLADPEGNELCVCLEGPTTRFE